MSTYHLRFRLRVANEIVGFERVMQSGSFYSKDEYAWSGNAIEYECKDPWSGLLDSHQKHIYANDILVLKEGGIEQHLLVVFDEVLNQFNLVDYSDDTLVHTNMSVYLSNKHFRRLAFNFKQELP